MNLEQKTITSMEVAEMVDKPHNELLKDMRRYTEQLGEVNIPQSDFFKESTYTNLQNKELPCYNVTKKGCEFIGNKLTGIKGTEFTAKYINRFHDMEEIIKQPKSNIELLELSLNAIKEVDTKIDSVDRDLQTFKKDMPLLAVDLERIKNARNRKTVPLLGGKDSPAYKDNSLRGKVYSDSAQQVWREFGVGSFKQIKRCQCDLVIKIIDKYELPLALSEAVENCNAQMNFA